jgi:hypothetical protein
LHRQGKEQDKIHKNWPKRRLFSIFTNLQEETLSATETQYSTHVGLDNFPNRKRNTENADKDVN